MEACPKDREETATTDRGPGTRRNRGAPPLPLAARRALWDRTWDRLLGPAADPGPSAQGEPGEATSTPAPLGKGGAR